MDICRQWGTGDKHCAQPAREHGITQSVLYRWRAENAQQGEAAFGGQPGASGGAAGASTTEALLLQQIGA